MFLKLRKIKYSIAFLVVFACFDVCVGQNSAKSVGIITLKISSKYESASKMFFDVPVNEKFPIIRGDGLRVEPSHSEEFWQLSSIAVADKNNAERALLKITLRVADKRGRIKIVEEKVRLLRGQHKKFRLKNSEFHYEIVAYYEPVKK